MARRSEDWSVGLAQDLRSPEFAREFLLAAVEDGVPVQVALGRSCTHLFTSQCCHRIDQRSGHGRNAARGDGRRYDADKRHGE